MYRKEQLERYPYFRRLLEENELEGLLDQLTGIVSRGYILSFAQHLITLGLPFSFAILDLDNFKFINDTYGHHAGDSVLMNVAKDLQEYLGDKGVCGRFGGDEFLIIDMADLTYDACKVFFTGMFDGRVLRKNIQLENANPFITGTIGCAGFPRDADNYDDLFAMIDKTLYRGKTKGRNCHIIYVEEKHRNIEIRKLARRGLYTVFKGMIRLFDHAPGLHNKLQNVMPMIMEEMQVSDLFFTGLDGRLRAVREENLNEDAGDIGNLLPNDDMFSTNDLETIRNKAPITYATLHRREVETLLVIRVGMDGETDGYLICAEARNRRIWQEAECAILYFLARQLAAYIRLTGEKL